MEVTYLRPSILNNQRGYNPKRLKDTKRSFIPYTHYQPKRLMMVEETKVKKENPYLTYFHDAFIHAIKKVVGTYLHYWEAVWVFIIAAFCFTVILSNALAASYEEEEIEQYNLPSEPYMEATVMSIFDMPEEEIIDEIIEEEIVDDPIVEYIVEEVVEGEIPEPVYDAIYYSEDIITPLAEQIVPGTPIQYLGSYNITGYDPLCVHCCGKSDGITASGAYAEYYKTVAMNDVPFGTRVYIPGYGVFTVQDTGGGAVGVDIACPNHDACYAVTQSGVDVYIIME